MADDTSAPDEDEIYHRFEPHEDESFVIGGLESIHDLDPRFRPDERFLARGPFRVFSPEADSWSFGYNLEQIGLFLTFQDGSSLGRSFSYWHCTVRATDDGAIIWVYANDANHPELFVLTPANLDDLRSLAPKGLQITNVEDGAPVAMRELELKRHALFGISDPALLVSRLGIVCWREDRRAIWGLFFITSGGTVHQRRNHRWHRITADDDQPWMRPGNDGGTWFPALHGVINRFDEVAESDAHSAGRPDNGTVTRKRTGLLSFWYPQVHLEVEDDWADDLDAMMMVL